jgi:hypothetical protein
MIEVESVKEGILNVREHLAGASGQGFLVFRDAKLKVAFLTPLRTP